MRKYAYGEVLKPKPKPRDSLTLEKARRMIDLRDALRAVRLGDELQKHMGALEARTPVGRAEPQATPTLPQVHIIGKTRHDAAADDHG